MNFTFEFPRQITAIAAAAAVGGGVMHVRKYLPNTLQLIQPVYICNVIFHLSC